MPASEKARRRPTRAMWIVALASAALVFLVPLGMIEAQSQPGTEIRVVSTGDRLSVDIVDGPHRVLIMNAVRVADARSTLGRLTRPWESRPNTIIAPGDDFAAAGLWEAIQMLEPRQVFVIGAPGAGQTWSMIERYARANEISVRYVSDARLLQLDDLTISLIPFTGTGRRDPSVVVRRDGINVAIALGQEVPNVQSQLLVASTGQSPLPGTSLLVTNRRQSPDTTFDYVHVGRSNRVSIRFKSHQVHVSGGEYFTGVRQGW